mgnify:CR=1 FL=1
MARALLVTTALLATLSPALPAAADDDPDMETTEASPVGIDSSGNSLPWQPDNSEAAGPADSEDSVPGHKPDSTESAPSSVIAGDDRVQFTDTTSYPNSAIVYITKDGKTHCTGWMISADTLVTAGHCVYSYEREEWFSGLEFSPGANGSERPFETAKAVQTWTDVSWVKKGSPLLDWGVVKLDKRLGERSGWFGFAWRSGEYKDIKTELRGYPYDKNPGELWGMAGPVKKSQPNQLCYYTDTIGGQSGSPVYLQNRFFAIAIHAYGVGKRDSNDLCPAEYNAGTRITESLYSVILNLR